MKIAELFSTHPVFSLDEATIALTPKRGRLGMVEQLKYHLRANSLKLS